MIDWLNTNSGAVQGLAALASVLILLVVAVATIWYASLTEKIGKAAEAQANSSSLMAAVMRDDRRAADQPYLLVETSEGPGPPLFSENQSDELEEVPEGEAWNAAYPRELSYKIQNAGRGPAIGVSTTFLHSVMLYQTRWRDILRPGETWEIALDCSTPEQTILEVFGGGEPTGFNRWIESRGVDGFSDSPSDCGIVVTCRDIYEQKWLTYMKMRIDQTALLNMLYRRIWSGPQQVAPLGGSRTERHDR